MNSWANSFDKCFTQHYQPIVNIQSLRLEGHEALLRPRGFARDTEALIGQMERNGTIFQLDLWSVRQCLNRLSQTPGESRISINLSALNVCDPLFLEELEWLLSMPEHQKNLSRVSFEITESHPLADMKLARQLVNMCREHGITVGLDDFGTGNAKLSIAQDLGLDYIKIASRLTRSMLESAPARTLIERTTHQAQESGMKIIAEHVESPMQYAWLKDCNIEMGQGWLFAKAAPQLRANPCFKTEVEGTIRSTHVGHKHSDGNVYSLFGT